jgi:hypothetical protein
MNHLQVAAGNASVALDTSQVTYGLRGDLALGGGSMCYLYSTAAKQRGTVRSWNRLLSTEEQLAYYWNPPVPSVKTV